MVYVFVNCIYKFIFKLLFVVVVCRIDELIVVNFCIVVMYGWFKKIGVNWLRRMLMIVIVFLNFSGFFWFLVFRLSYIMERK